VQRTTRKGKTKPIKVAGRIKNVDEDLVGDFELRVKDEACTGEAIERSETRTRAKTRRNGKTIVKAKAKFGNGEDVLLSDLTHNSVALYSTIEDGSSELLTCCDITDISTETYKIEKKLLQRRNRKLDDSETAFAATDLLD